MLYRYFGFIEKLDGKMANVKGLGTYDHVFISFQTFWRFPTDAIAFFALED